MEQKLYHITTLQEWEAALDRGEYQPKQFASDGFIHCSYKHQLIEVANRFFRGQTNLVILVINPTHISSKIVTENLEGGTELYPHIYRKLPVESVTTIIPFNCEADDKFQLPSLLI